MLAEYYEKQGNVKANLAGLPMVIYHYEKCHNRAKVYEYKIAYLSEYYTLINENFPVLHWGWKRLKKNLSWWQGPLRSWTWPRK